MLTLSLQWSFSFWIFARNDLSKLGPTVVTIVLSMLWMFALGPHPFRNLLKASFASAIFIISMYLIRPAYITSIQGGLVVGLLLGVGLRKSLDQMLRFRFFIGEQNKLLEVKNAKIDSIFKASPVGMLIIEEDQTIGADLSPAVQHILGTDVRAGTPVDISHPELDTPAIRDIAFHILPHLVNNAIDHGLEAPGQRRASGKPEQGRIHLTLSLERETCVWHFRDDGRGLDLQALRNKIGPKSRTLSDDELAQYIFSRGLSTAKSISGLSGRGVGLEAVADILQVMGGKYRVCLLPTVGECHPFYFEFISPLNGKPVLKDLGHAV